ncbi:glycosyltransferase [Cryomorphaceae bacterium 1068]|nr:glycosyltransferase [Cryomorphaceae bacterium 1068]
MEKRVLYAVLNWGLGHATRSVPIIESLQHFGAEVEITSSGLALSYLKKRFPAFVFYDLPDREILYSKKGAKSGMIKRALVQSNINSEQHRFISKLVEAKKFTHIVSDNVYGAYNDGVPSALISHQLSLKAPFGESLINAKLANWINQFSEVWIPDGPNHLVSGDLASSQKVMIPKKHLGIPSRFMKDNIAEKKYRIGVVLGGPEPQRSILEKHLLKILKSIEGKKILFRGSESIDELGDDSIENTPLGDGEEMASKLAACELVIGRSGYSTICDLMVIGSKALLIPTPGQSEQEYLAGRMRIQPQFSTCSQEKLDVERIKRGLNKEFQTKERFGFFKSDSKVVEAFLKQ